MVAIAGLDDVDHRVGRLGQFVAFVICLDIGGQRRPTRRHRGPTERRSEVRHGRRPRSLAEADFLYFLPLLQGQGSFRPILAISPTSLQRTDPVYQAVLADAKCHEQLLVFDRDLAASARAARCWLCGGAPACVIV